MRYAIEDIFCPPGGWASEVVTTNGVSYPWLIRRVNLLPWIDESTDGVQDAMFEDRY